MNRIYCRKAHPVSTAPTPKSFGAMGAMEIHFEKPRAHHKTCIATSNGIQAVLLKINGEFRPS